MKLDALLTPTKREASDGGGVAVAGFTGERCDLGPLIMVPIVVIKF